MPTTKCICGSKLHNTTDRVCAEAAQDGIRRAGYMRVVQYADRWVAECTACSKIGEGNNPTSAHGSVTHRDGCCGAS